VKYQTQITGLGSRERRLLALSRNIFDQLVGVRRNKWSRHVSGKKIVYVIERTVINIRRTNNRKTVFDRIENCNIVQHATTFMREITYKKVYAYHQGEYLTLHPFAHLRRYLSAKLNQRGEESFEFGVVPVRVGRRAGTCVRQKRKR